ncbi:BON domain-containing protein [Streptomyces longisporoflavus]|uniref:BON domain-containing protein n=1 Tax=Streptomyces longisporoflavus TaxID=28044 RepID=A0ABW7QJC8_9ACTN
MARYSFTPGAGHRLEVPLSDEPDKAAAQLKGRLEDLGLTHDHFRVSVEGSEVTVSGDAAMQEQKEKILLALGNVVGVAEVEDRVAAGQEGLAPRFVTVHEGETLGDVALRVYGDPAAVGRLLPANHPILTDANEIYPGLVLRAPA